MRSGGGNVECGIGDVNELAKGNKCREMERR